MEKTTSANAKPTRIILASESPRRREILEKAGIVFETMPGNIDETIPEHMMYPNEIAIYLAQKKAEYALETLESGLNPESAANLDNILIIAADTIVVSKNSIFGKPDSEDVAFYMLKELQGKIHRVFTGVSLIKIRRDKAADQACAQREITKEAFAERTCVTIASMTDYEITEYIKTGEPMDKAGAYAVQGRGCVFVERIDGDFYNVMGLPVSRLYSVLKEMGVNF
jgi:septum formation protein